MADPDATSASQRFLTFRSEGRLYALPAAQVSEVVRMLPLARVPQAPKSLMGLANLRGAVVPVASMRGLLGRDDPAVMQASRLIVLGGAAPVALAVDDVVQLLRIEAGKVSTAQADVASDGGEQLTGVFESDSQVIKILDMPALLRRGFARSTPAPQAAPKKVAIAAAPEQEMRRRRLLTFDVAGQEYALPLEAVREIVDAPAGVTSLPGSDVTVRGVMSYRDGLLPLLSLRVLLGMPAQAQAREKVLVVPVGDILIGFIADHARAVLSADPSHIEPAPAVLSARAGGEAQIREIYHAGKGRLVSILTPDRLLRDDVMQKLKQGEGAMTPVAADPTGRVEQGELRFLVFRLDHNEFALPIDAVDEVARVPEQITRLPKTPKFLEGVVNLRGEVLPVVDQRRRFDMTPSDGSATRRLIVVRTDKHRAGLIVDGVSEVLRCSADAIEPAPDLTGDAQGLVHSVINLDAAGRIVLLLDPAELLTRTERGLLDSFAKEARKETRQQPS
ncbi:MAG: chemotaxis protein CheW [Tardiphaga sp.]